MSFMIGWHKGEKMSDEYDDLVDQLDAAKEELETYKRMIAPEFTVAAFKSIQIMSQNNQDTIRLWTKAAYHNARMSDAIQQILDHEREHMDEKYYNGLLEKLYQTLKDYKEEDFRIG